MPLVLQRCIIHTHTHTHKRAFKSLFWECAINEGARWVFSFTASLSRCAFWRLKVIPPFIFKLGWALSRICVALTLFLFSAILNKNSPTFFLCVLVLHSYNNTLVNLLWECRDRQRVQAMVKLCVCVCVWPVSSDSFVLNYSISLLLSPEFPRGPTLFFFHDTSLSIPSLLLLSLSQKMLRC